MFINLFPSLLVPLSNLPIQSVLLFGCDFESCGKKQQPLFWQKGSLVGWWSGWVLQCLVRTSINTWQCCASAVTQGTPSPLRPIKSCQHGRVVGQFQLSLPRLILSFHLFSGLVCLLITSRLLSYCHFADIDADPHTLPWLSLPLLIFWLTLPPSLSLSLSVSATAVMPVSLFLASVWLRVTQERSKQGNDCHFPFLLFSSSGFDITYD